eukprot:5108451-Prymnesium_polylepis.1
MSEPCADAAAASSSGDMALTRAFASAADISRRLPRPRRGPRRWATASRRSEPSPSWPHLRLGPRKNASGFHGDSAARMGSGGWAAPAVAISAGVAPTGMLEHDTSETKEMQVPLTP